MSESEYEAQVEKKAREQFEWYAQNYESKLSTLDLYMPVKKIKWHLNIDQDFTDDDDYLKLLRNMVVDYVTLYCNIPVIKYIGLSNGSSGQSSGKKYDQRPFSSLELAIYILIGNFYANRESVIYTSVSQLPHSIDNILGLLRNYEDSAL
jgi:hypothetical protein